jgi:hypothetical protein
LLWHPCEAKAKTGLNISRNLLSWNKVGDASPRATGNYVTIKVVVVFAKDCGSAISVMQRLAQPYGVDLLEIALFRKTNIGLRGGKSPFNSAMWRCPSNNADIV